MWQRLAAVLALGAGEVGAEESTAFERLLERADLMRDVDLLTASAATPVAPSRVQGEFSLASRPLTGEPGVVLGPRVRLGLPWRLELGAGAGLATGGEAEPSTVEVAGNLLGQVLVESGSLPALSLQGTVAPPTGDGGPSAEARVLASKSIGTGQVHANAAYRNIEAEADEYILALAADRAVGDSWLVRGDVYFARSLGDSPADSAGFDVGASLMLGERWVVSAVGGLNTREGDVTPRVLFGVLGQL